MRIDFGDVIAHVTLEVPGLRRWGIMWRIGPALDTTPADRTSHTPGTPRDPNRKVDLLMDLQADKKVTLSVEWTDEVGNPTSAPADGTGDVTYAVDNADVIALTDNGDGSAVAAATGSLGDARVSVTAHAGGRTLTGDLDIHVVAGLAERVNIVASAPEEVTPDAAPADAGTPADGSGQTGPEVGAGVASEVQPGA